MKSSLIINSIDANNQARQKSFPNINPNASNANVCTFAKKVNALTTNEFVSAIRVDKKPLDDSTPEPVVKQTPTLTLSEFTKDGTTYTATITYTGDGELTTKLGTITDNTLTIEDADGTFNSTVSASETDNFLAATYAFSRVGKKTPSLSVGDFSLSGSNLNATISYTGDGTLSTNLGTISNNTLTVSNNSSTFYGTVSSSETENYIAAQRSFTCGVRLGATKHGSTISGSNGHDTLRTTYSTVVANGGAGNDSINVWFSNYVTINGGTGNDTLDDTGGTVHAFYGGDGDDSIQSSTTSVTADGGAGNDIIDVTYSNYVTINGGTGNDTIRAGNYTTIIHNANTGNDTITKMRSDDTLKISGSYSTQISGLDVLARTGNDTITLQDAMLTADTLNINSTAIPLSKSITLTSGDDTISNTRNDVSIDGGGGNDSINNTGVSVSIDAGEGNDSINNSGSSVTISGGTGNDSITNSSSNVLFTYAAGDGNDIINGFNSTSTLSIVGASYSTQVSGSNVLVHVGDGTITLKGVLSSLNAIHINNDEIALPNAVTLTSGDDTISNARASVSIYGGEGNDSIYNNAASVSIDVGAGNDTINTSSNAANVVIYGGEGNDSIYSAHINTIYGGAGDDTITNNGSREVTIDGGSGNDIIYQVGRLGSISGGTGNDLISLGANATQTANSIFYNLGDGNDTIINFKPSDTLYVSGSTFTTATSGNDVIVNVGSEYITIQGGATISPLNIVSA